MSTLYGLAPKYNELQLKLLKIQATAGYLMNRAIEEVTDEDEPTMDAHFVRDEARDIYNALEKLIQES